MTVPKFTCLDVVRAAGLKEGRKSGAEQLIHCIGPGHARGDENPSLSLNIPKGKWFCGPCGKGGESAWSLAAFLAGLDPEDRPAVTAWCNERGLINGRDKVPNAIYPYTKKDSTLSYEVCRYQNGSGKKTFKVRRPDGNGGWIWNIDGVERVLYHLPEVLKAETIYIAEGEKNVEDLYEIGLVATCNVFGAGKWNEKYADCFQKHQRIVVLRDNDEAGLKHRDQVLASLVGRVKSLKGPELEGLAEKGDISNWIHAGGTREKLEALVASTPEWAPSTSGSERGPQTVWDTAQPVAEFIQADDEDVDFIYPRLLAPGAITQMFSPRGLGKSQVMTAVLKDITDRGKRALLLDRDNPRREVRRRLRGWAAMSPNLKVMAREIVPPLTDPKAWSTFPFADYDVVVIDSLDSSAEGVGEQDSSKPAKAIAPLLDIAHRAGGPAVLVLGNTVRSAAHSRGSGVVEDRADIVFEVRDATGLKPSGEKPWHEELPPASASDWAQRATRRKRRDTYRLALIPTKYRIGEEPDPFIYQISMKDDEPWQLEDITEAVIHAGDKAKEESRKAKEALRANAISSLKTAIPTKEYTKADAEGFLMNNCKITQKAAREMIEQHDGRHWKLVRHPERKGRPFILTIVDPSK